MNLRVGCCRWALSVLLGMAGLSHSLPTKAEAFMEISWDALMPQDWDPFKHYQGVAIETLADDAPEVQQIMRAMRIEWDQAPVVAALNDTAIRLVGYLVPLEETDGRLKEFLLVPYFGACIHMPPPPANQIIQVRLLKPVKGFRTMDTVWVKGRLQVERQDSGMGIRGYRMDAVRIERYVPEQSP